MSKFALPKLGQAKILARIFLPKPCQVLCEVGSFFGFQPIECQNFLLPKFWQGKFWNQTNHALYILKNRDFC